MSSPLKSRTSWMMQSPPAMRPGLWMSVVTGLLGVFLLARVAVAQAAGATNAAAKPARTEQPAASALLVAPLHAFRTWRVGSGSAEGWALGDRVRVVRGTRTVALGVLIKLSPHAAQMVLTSAVVSVRPGDRILFVRHRPHLVLAAPPVTPLPGQGGTVVADTTHEPTDWRRVGAIPGLLGNDWMERYTTYTHDFARAGDVPYLRAVVDGLDESYQVNVAFMGVTPQRLPVTFYFFPMANPAHTQPRFAARLVNDTRFMGLAMPEGIVLINLGNWRTSANYAPWDLEVVCRHELNHECRFSVHTPDRMGTWPWLDEALAHTIEDTARPAQSRLTMADIASFMRGYHFGDSSWQALIRDRNNDQLEQYRDYSKILVSVVFFLEARYGHDVVRHLVQTARTMDIEDAFIAVCGKGTRALLSDWKAFYHMK